MDKIHINGISCLAHLGVPPQERENPQEILVDVVLTLNLDKAIHSDEVTSTVDYVRIVEKVKETVEERRFSLLETVAGQLCRAILTDAQIKSVQVRVRKFPEALRDQVSYVEVEMTRQSG
jgi:dihydroneopterin aldolase